MCKKTLIETGDIHKANKLFSYATIVNSEAMAAMIEAEEIFSKHGLTMHEIKRDFEMLEKARSKFVKTANRVLNPSENLQVQYEDWDTFRKTARKWAGIDHE
ncbi:MAG TPA: hypothetical protein DCS17_01910 [Flavobacterium sp.]|nr:hypothetical protein [Flavobacterium sp.]